MLGQRVLRLSAPVQVVGQTSSTPGEPTLVSIDGVVYDLVVVNRSVDYSLYVSFDGGNRYVEVAPDSALVVVLAAGNVAVAVKSDGASQPFKVVYRLML